jgi:hypothetical protein
LSPSDLILPSPLLVEPIKPNNNQIDLSLNRSHLTMEDNNKIQQKLEVKENIEIEEERKSEDAGI